MALATSPSWAARGRARPSVSSSDLPVVARPVPSRSGSADARARLSRISSNELRASTSTSSDARSIRSFASGTDDGGSTSPSTSRSPAKRQRLSEATDATRRATWYGGQQPDTISEDPSASLVLANESPPAEPAAPALKKQRSWTEMYREYAMGEAPMQDNAEVSTSELQVDEPKEEVKVEVATEESKAVSEAPKPVVEALEAQPTTLPTSASWFAYLSRSRSMNVAEAVKTSVVQEGTPNKLEATVEQSAKEEADAPMEVDPPKPPSPLVAPVETITAPPPAVRRPSIDSVASGSPNQESMLRTLLVGKGKRPQRGTSKPPSVIETPTVSPVAASEPILPASQPSVQPEGAPSSFAARYAQPHERTVPAPPQPALQAPPVAMSSSRSSWWSRSPVVQQEPTLKASEPPPTSSQPSEAAAPVKGEMAKLEVPKPTAQPSPPREEAAPVYPPPNAKPAQPGWYEWWTGVSEDKEATAEAPIEVEPQPMQVEPVAAAAPLNPIVDTLPSSRSTWTRYFGGSVVKPTRGALKGEMEVMEVDFSSDSPIQVASSSIDGVSKSTSRPSSVRSAPPPSASTPEPVKSKPAAKPLTTSKKVSKAPSAPSPPNLVLPTFKDTFERPPRSLAPRQGAIAKALSVVNSYMFSAPAAMTNAPAGKIDLSERLPKTLAVMGASQNQRYRAIKRVAVIGVHGWFPAKWLSSLVGQPTGTSPKFASMMSTAVREYLRKQGIKLEEDALTSIALEGEGKIEDRVNRLYVNLKAKQQWLEDLRAADLIFVATHSQGSVVSPQLLARLIDEGVVVGSKVVLLCMAPVSHGPFMHISQSYALQPYFQYLEGEAARELFTLQESDSGPTKSYRSSMQRILGAGVKVVLVASCDDQVVPLSSGLFHALSHPGVLRAVFVDSQAFAASDFVVNLVTFALRLRNAGLSDHDLLPQLSEALAGSLTGVGHSRIYDETEVYSLAVRYAFETTSTLSIPTTSTSLAPIPVLLDSAFDPRAKRNPHYLPWILRGVIEDRRVRELFSEELADLREAFEDWHPVSKALKEVKWQLEPLRLLPRRAQIDALVNKTAKL